MAKFQPAEAYLNDPTDSKSNDKYGYGLSINEWYKDIQKKGYSLSKIPEEERTLEMCFIAIRYWGAALEFVPEKYKTYELCLDAVRHNIPTDECRSALAFVPEKFKTAELCLEAIRHDYMPPAFFEPDINGGFHEIMCYAPAIIFTPQNIRTPELCFQALQHFPTGMPGYLNFSGADVDENLPADLIMPKSIQAILESEKLFLKALKRMGMPDEFIDEALEMRQNFQLRLPESGDIK